MTQSTRRLSGNVMTAHLLIVLWCPAYGHLRIDKNLEEEKDLTRYFQQVLILRD
jgi:hypothetical protein